MHRRNNTLVYNWSSQIKSFFKFRVVKYPFNNPVKNVNQVFLKLKVFRST